MRILLSTTLLMLGITFCAAVHAAEDVQDTATYRDWIESMKEAERGPFSRIRWFCADGTVLPPKAYACAPHGGGVQHGEWSEQTRHLRDQGYYVANLLAGMDPEAFLASPDADDQLAQLLIERFLIAADDGWILRRALFYRGAIQEEDERAAARNLLTELVSRDQWITSRYVVLRSAVHLLPHGADSASVQKVRQMSASLSDRDASFKPLRAKIHGAPAADDAARVRDYATDLDESARAPYLALADEIDRVYQSAPLGEELQRLAEKYTAAPWLQSMLANASKQLSADDSAANRFAQSASLLAQLRRSLGKVNAPAARLELLDLSLRLESEHFKAASELRPGLEQQTRHQRLNYLESAGLAAFGSGVINERLLGELQRSLGSLAPNSVSLAEYVDELRYLGHAPGWGTQGLRMYFYESMERLAAIEPKAMLFIQDQLRGSPLLFYSAVLDGLSRDASRLAGVTHRMFGKTIGVGFTALNPGLASGVLQLEPDLENLENYRADSIYVLPETVSDLPPIAGILTEGEGNPLSHVQLLARNLGIPNVTLDSSLKPALAEHEGERIVMAVSKSGLVELALWESRWESVFKDAAKEGGVRINPDLEKLDLSVRRLISLDELRASDSGAIVGPKAAKLGELRTHYPGRVSRGVAIPFGLFRQEALDRPHPRVEGSVFDWMVANYRSLEQIPRSDPKHAEQAEAFRTELYGIIADTQPSDGFKQQVRAAMQEAFGSDNPPGVFVRSDTNVEDLAGFTGAGLNLTLPNVVGFDRLMESIAEVWASPFTDRAFAWRQSHMTRPEHVYTSILLLESVASDKSGVLVTQDIDTGDRNVISVAVNEGLGGAVDGQAAESLRIPLDGGHVRVLATATAPLRRVPAAQGGLDFLPSSGSDTVLKPGEVQQLIEFASGLPQNFPPITDDEGNSAPADVEFGFVDGKLRLFQLRPFLESKMAQGIDYLHDMESRLKDNRDVIVELDEVPGS